MDPRFASVDSVAPIQGPTYDRLIREPAPAGTRYNPDTAAYEGITSRFVHIFNMEHGYLKFMHQNYHNEEPLVIADGNRNRNCLFLVQYPKSPKHKNAVEIKHSQSQRLLAWNSNTHYFELHMRKHQGYLYEFEFLPAGFGLFYIRIPQVNQYLRIYGRHQNYLISSTQNVKDAAGQFRLETPLGAGYA